MEAWLPVDPVPFQLLALTGFVLAAACLLLCTPLRYVLPTSLRHQLAWRGAAWRARGQTARKRRALLRYRRYVYMVDMALAWRAGVERSLRLSEQGRSATVRKVHRLVYRALAGPLPSAFHDFSAYLSDFTAVELADLAVALCNDVGCGSPGPVIDFLQAEQKLLRTDGERLLDHPDRMSEVVGRPPFPNWKLVAGRKAA